MIRLGTIVALAATAAVGAAAERSPNIVLILADDLGWSDLGVYGSDLHETPNLDAFARSALRFTQAYAASPVCSPTRAAILTGRHPARLGMTVWREAARRPPLDRALVPPRTLDHLPLAETTLAELFREAGYRTAHIGKWHLGRAEHYPQTQGFDVNIGGTLWGAPQTFFHPYSGDRHFGGEPRYVPGLADGRNGEYLTDRLTDEALRLIERYRAEPFFLHLAYHSVHTPIEGKLDLVKRFEAKLSAGLKHRNAQYAAMVASLDENVGRVLAKLDKLGLSERTVVVFTSDNGGFVNSWQGRPVTDNAPLRSGKGSAYEGGLRVPAMIRAPGLTTAGAVSDAPIVSMDLFPTLLAIAGVPRPRGVALDGLDLTPLLRDPEARPAREALYFHYPHYYPTTTPVSAVRLGDWKLLEYYEDGRLELCNLAEDPGERRDLAAAEPERADAMRRRLRLWLAEVGAQLPLGVRAAPDQSDRAANSKISGRATRK